MGKTINKNIKIYNEKKILEAIVVGRPYHPKNSAIIIIKKGYIFLKNNLQKLKLVHNSIFYLYPKGVYEFVEFSSDIELKVLVIDTGLVSNLALNFNRFNTYQILMLASENYFSINDSELSQMWNLISVLEENLSKKRTAFSSHINRHLFFSIIYLSIDIVNKYIDINAKEITRKEEIALDFFKNLAIYFKEKREVKFYAELLSITSRHLSATLKEVTGFTANELIHQSVITEGKILLRSSKKQISEIAQELHFNDQYYFSNFFKKFTGQSPSEFRINAKPIENK